MNTSKPLENTIPEPIRQRIKEMALKSGRSEEEIVTECMKSLLDEIENPQDEPFTRFVKELREQLRDA